MKTKILYYLWILSLLLTSLPTVYANKLQRWQFKEAYNALSNKDLKSFERLSAQLSNYPIAHYLRYFYLRAYLKEENAQTIQAFLDQHQGSPTVPPLRRAWLRQLVKKRDWETFITAYTPQKNTLLRCHYLKVHLHTVGKLNDELVAEAKDLWRVGKSQPTICDPAFNYLYKHDLITHQDRWQRLSLAMKKGKLKLARFIAKDLPKVDQKLIAQWQSMHKKPARTLKNFKHPDTAIAQEIVLYGIKRLARKDADSAYQYWKTYNERYHFKKQEKEELFRYIVLKGVAQNHPDAARWLEEIDKDYVNNTVNQAKLKIALIAENWEGIIKLNQSLTVLDEKNQHQWQYWWARALEQTGQTNEAEKHFQALSQYRDYYGFLAANGINKPYSFYPKALNISKTQTNQILKKHKGLIRARELHLVGWPAFARSEWNRVLPNLTQEELKAATVIAHKWEWHDRAISTAYKVKVRDDLNIRFPLPFYDTVVTHAEAQELKLAYVYGIMRQESVFQSDVRSSAGALGLMQLMPATAKEVARKQKIKLKHPQSILIPKINIQLGTAYLRQMLNRFNDNYLLATVAYNAGATRAKRWAKKYGCFSPDIWIELIPFKETRNYVKRVLSYTPIFEFQMLGHSGVKPMLLDTILTDDECVE
jgi:soluble lytic murein transglycosylase